MKAGVNLEIEETTPMGAEGEHKKQNADQLLDGQK